MRINQHTSTCTCIHPTASKLTVREGEGQHPQPRETPNKLLSLLKVVQGFLYKLASHQVVCLSLE